MEWMVVFHFSFRFGVEEVGLRNDCVVNFT